MLVGWGCWPVAPSGWPPRWSPCRRCRSSWTLRGAAGPAPARLAGADRRRRAGPGPRRRRPVAGRGGAGAARPELLRRRCCDAAGAWQPGRLPGPVPDLPAGRPRGRRPAGRRPRRRPGELLALLGPSGAGKSTLLALVGGLERPAAGRVWVDGQDLARLPEAALTAFRRGRVGFVLQTPARNLLPYASAAQNLELPMRLAGVPAARRRERAARCWRRPASRPRAAGRSVRCPVASSSGSPSPWRSPTSRRCCWPTSPPASSTAPTSHGSWSCCGPAGPDRHHGRHGHP